MNDIVTFLIHCTASPDESEFNIPTEACEFWIAFLEMHSEMSVKCLTPHIAQLVPTILNRMVYVQEELDELDDDDDAKIPDRLDQIKPRFARSKYKGSQNAQWDEETEEAENRWSLRKSAAYSLDLLARRIGDPLLSVVIPDVMKRLGHNDWLVRESAILALGAVADGTMSGMLKHLPELVPFLIRLTNDEQKIVRSIACWTLSRYSKWITRQPNPYDNPFFKPLVVTLIGRMADGSKRVQEAACSSFAALEEYATDLLVPFLQPTLNKFVECLQHYQAKNTILVYDALGTLAEHVHSALDKPELINIIMPPLMQKWQTTAPDDPRMQALLECMTSICLALRDNFAPFAPMVFQGCMQIAQLFFTQYGVFITNPNGEGIKEPQHDYLVGALDLLSALTEALGPKITGLLTSANIGSLLVEACKLTDYNSVKQSTFALIGDVVHNAYESVQSNMPFFINILIENIRPTFENMAVCHNAIWAFGEIAARAGNQMQPFVLQSLQQLIPMLNNLQMGDGLRENAAITIGRLAWSNPKDVAAYLQTFLRSYCMALCNVPDNGEKDAAFRGLVAAINVNPEPAVPHLFFLCTAIASWERFREVKGQPSLRDMLKGVIVNYKTMLPPEQWAIMWRDLHSDVKERLLKTYQLQG
eukprot:CAMPEP_0168522886 /NCGR_PEP_ID=MMETSP0405-20121227/9625_1 /TAXON_ID=498012 /ORGANISM="Trichosphaerium sp, Strain Am-I-7 wt" /LENGTH=645 /DNA_ID=CAMNT_0008544595 /DNA_START=85 /DNA_END=2022 /DNA_ORIENTATION=-